MRRFLSLSVLPLIFVGLLVPVADASDDDPGPAEFDAVRSLFKARCLRCHGADDPKAGLDLRNFETLMQGSEFGSVIEPGSLDESILWERVDLGEMPPDGPPLLDDQREALRSWIGSGASDDGSGSADRLDHPPPARPIDPVTLDEMTASEFDRLGIDPPAESTTDEQFLRRASFDLIGRPPSPEELAAFRDDPDPEKRSKAIDALLDRPEFGEAWAAYWSETIAHHVPPPELTFLDYGPFEGWLADRLNEGEPWDRIVSRILEAEGKVADRPEASFVAFHQADPVKLAAETSRVFLGLQIQCAECHDHKFDHWKRDQFHGVAAFFGRTKAKLSQNDPGPTVVEALEEGQYVMPDEHDPSTPGTEVAPTFLDGRSLDFDANDADRRALLASAVTDPENPWFSRAFVNRAWARLTGRGFFEPVDTMASYQRHDWPEVHDALAGHFAYGGYDFKALLRLIMNTEHYQRSLPLDEASGGTPPFGPPQARPLSGREVFEALAITLELPDLTPPKVEPTPEIRFPPPPQSTRDLVTDRFGFDPSRCVDQIPRTMGQAMLLMNFDQVQDRIDARPEADTPLSRLLQEQQDDAEAIGLLFDRTLGRSPSDRETSIALEHLENMGDRGRAFEDLLWSLINTAEFSTRR